MPAVASTASSTSAPTIDCFEHQSCRGDSGRHPDQIWSRSARSFLEWTPLKHHFRFERLRRLGNIIRERFRLQGSATTPRTRQDALDIPLERKNRARHPVRSWRCEFRYLRLSLWVVSATQSMRPPSHLRFMAFLLLD